MAIKRGTGRERSRVKKGSVEQREIDATKRQYKREVLVTCPTCKGKGEYHFRKCGLCKGKGKVYAHA